MRARERPEARSAPVLDPRNVLDPRRARCAARVAVAPRRRSRSAAPGIPLLQLKSSSRFVEQAELGRYSSEKTLRLAVISRIEEPLTARHPS